VSDPPGIASSVGSAVAGRFAVDPAGLTLETSLYDDVGADSLSVMELISALEDDLGIALPESSEFALTIRTVGDLVEAFETHAHRPLRKAVHGRGELDAIG
jgi:acyl carrier protein